MLSPSTSLVASAVPTTWWLPASAILLAVLGVLLFAAGMREPVLPMIPDVPPPRHQTARETGTALVPPSEPPHGGAVRAWGWDAVSAVTLDLASQWMPPRPADCLGEDLATGRRAESAHLGTVPLPRPGECGDLRDAVMELATLRYRSTR